MIREIIAVATKTSTVKVPSAKTLVPKTTLAREANQNNPQVAQGPLQDYPVQPWAEFSGYVHKKDPTLLPNYLLTYPTVNVFMPDGDVIVPREGELIFPQQNSIQNSPIIGHLKKYKNISGIEMEIRVWNDNTMTLISVIGTYTVGETIRGGVSGATAQINSISGSVITFENLLGTFAGGELITGQTSGAQGILSIYKGDVIEVLYQGIFQQITPNQNPLQKGLSNIGSKRIYYFDQWIDTNLDPALSINTNCAVWVMGIPKIRRWTGGIAPIVSIVPNISISVTTGITWSSLGFTDPLSPGLINLNTITGTFQIGDIITGSISGATGTISTVNPTNIFIHSVIGTFEPQDFIRGSISGATAVVSNYSAPYVVASNEIVVNGMVYVPTGGWETNTLTLSNTTGISVGNIAFSGIQELATPGTPATNFDYISAFKNYLTFGNFNLQKYWMANNFNRDSDENITAVQAVQDDLVLGTTPYTGIGQNVYRITIDSVFQNEQQFIPTGTSSGLNDGVFLTSNYIGTPGSTLPNGKANIYAVNIMADATLNMASISGFQIGEMVSGTDSSAQGIVIAAYTPIIPGEPTLAIQMLTDFMFTNGEVITGSNSATTATLTNAQYQNWIQFTLNGVVNNILTAVLYGSVPIAELVTTPIILGNGIIITFSNNFGHSVGDSFQLDIGSSNNTGNLSTSQSDTYSWSVNGETPGGSNIPIPVGIGNLLHGTITGGPFDGAETITGSVSGATAVVTSDANGIMYLSKMVGVFQTGETVTGGTSGAMTVVTSYLITGIPQFIDQYGLTISFISNTGHTIGDYWEITVDQSITNAWANFYYPLPRGPGYGFIGTLPANFWTMKPQEDAMYVNDASGSWGYVTSTLSITAITSAASTGNATETIDYTPLKAKGRNKVIFPYMIGYLDNDLCYVTEDKNVDLIGRMALIQLPQVAHLSDPVKLDFLAASFENGSIEYNGLKLYITSPEDLLMFCYDDAMHWWQPPQLIPENGILSEVGLDLISHSNIRNITNTLFTGTNDNGNPFPIRIRTGYNYFGNRWAEDVASMMFVEGYMTGNPNMIASAFLNVNGCAGIVQGPVDPVYCISPDRAPFGYGSLGSHSHGSDEDSPNPWFQWIGVGQRSFAFYMAAFDLVCSSLDPQFEILSMAFNTVASENNNSKLKRGQVALI